MQSNEHLNHKNSNRSTLLIQFADLGVEEEFHTDNDLNNLAGNKITPAKPCLLNSWYLSFSENFIFKTYTRSKALALNYVVSSDPIYLIIGVLRI